MTTVPGDPAALSSLAAQLGRHGRRLAGEVDRLGDVVTELAPWQGRGADVARDRLHADARALAATSDTLAACASVVQSYVVELSRARAVGDHARGWCEARGLGVGLDGVVRPARRPVGLHLVGDPASEVAADHAPQGQLLVDSAREEAQEAADRLAARLGPLVQALAAVGTRLAEAAPPARRCGHG